MVDQIPHPFHWKYDCLIAKNTSEVHGGGIHNDNTSAIITGCTIADNTSQFRGAGIYNTGTSQPPTLDTILYNNLPEEIGNTDNGRPLANFSIVRGGLSSGVFNLDVDPLFVSPATNNYSLQAGSPAIDQGADADPSVTGVFADDFERFPDNPARDHLHVAKRRG